MISEHFLYYDRTQTIESNSDGVIGCKLTEWCTNSGENQVIEIGLIDDDETSLLHIYVSKDDFIKAAKKIMVE